MKFKVFPDHLYLFGLTLNFLKMASVLVHFSPGFLSVAGYCAEQFAPAWFYRTPEE
jgi:hypothetical protein